MSKTYERYQKKEKVLSKENTTESHHITREESKRRKEWKRTTKTINKKAVCAQLSMITLNVNGLHSPIKRYRVIEEIEKKKQDSSTCCLQEAHFKYRDTHKLNVKGWKKIFHVAGNKENWRSHTPIKNNKNRH